MKIRLKRALSGFLALVMVLSLVSLPATAAEEQGDLLPRGETVTVTPGEEMAEDVKEDAAEEPAEEIVEEMAEAEANTLHDGLVLYSTFDDADRDGTTVKNLADDTKNGTAVGTLEFVTGIDNGKAVKIAGQTNAGNDKSAGDRYIDYGKSAGIVPATEDFSISLWFKSVGTATSNVSLLGTKDYSNGGNPGIAFGIVSSVLCYNLGDTAKTRKELKGSNDAMNNVPKDETWHHLVCTYDRDGNMVGYVDNQQSGTISISGLGSIEAGLNLVLGAGGNYFNASNNCLMDELLIYNRIITATEIAALFSKEKPDVSLIEPEPDVPTPAPEPGMILHSSFDNSDAANDVENSSYQGSVTSDGGITFVDSALGGKAVRIINADAADGSANDGKAAKNYIDYGAPISADTFGDGKSFTVSYWYKHDTDSTKPNGYGTFISNEDYYKANTPGFAVGYYSANGKTNFVSTGGGGRKQTDGINFDQKGWHHFAFTVTSGGNMLVYQDGVQIKSVATSGGSAHGNLPLVVGADGKHQNPITNIQMDELSVFNYALPKEDVNGLYTQFGNIINAMEILTSIKDALSGISASVVFSQTAIDEMTGKVDNALEQVSAGTLTGEATSALVAEIQADYQTFCDGAKPLASFHMISDVHVDSKEGTDGNALNYIAAMKDMTNLNKDTTIAMVSAGDFTNSGTANQYEGFYKVTKEHKPVTDDQTLVLLGNHDVRGSSTNQDPARPDLCPDWPAKKALYQTNNAPYMPAAAEETLYHSKTLGTVTDTDGYTFIMLNTEMGLKDAMYMSPTQITWFEAEMKKAYDADPNKPIFIISHQALNDTHWRSNTLNGFDGVKPDGTGYDYQTGADAKVKEIMAKYPNGIFFSGHIHNGYGVASVIPRDYGVSVDVPALKGADRSNGYAAAGAGYEVMIYEGYVALRARNFVTGTWLPEYDVIVPVGDHGYPQLIQKLEGTMDDLLWYSEADAAKLEDVFGNFWENVGLQYNQTGIGYLEPAPKDGIYLPDQLAVMSLAADAAWESIGVLSEVTRLDTPRPAPKTPYQVLRENWRAYLLGGTGDDLDLTVPAIANYVENLNADATNYWNSLIRSDKSRTSFIFPDLNMTPIDGNSSNAAAAERSSNVATSFSRLRTLAFAWATKGTSYYQNDYVRDEIINATDFVVNNYYNKDIYATKKAQGNWYHWDISSTTALGNVAMVMYDELGAARVKRYGESIQWFAPKCEIGGPHSLQSGAMTGGNLLLKGNGVAQAGILLEDSSMLDNVSTQVKKTVGTYNTPSKLFLTTLASDGFYADGSYIQHNGLPYMAGYGADLYNNFSVFGATLKGSEWAIAFQEDESAPIYDMVFSGIEPFLYDNHIMDMVSGRGISRKGYSDRGKVADILSAILPMRGSFPTEEQNARFDSMAKYYLTLDTDYLLERISSIYSVKIVTDLLNDSSVKPRSEYALTKTFAMDRTVHITPDFGMGIAMQSTRTYAHESVNHEGKRTWNIANGMVFLYDGDIDQYNGGYWCTIDPTRLPGTTTEHVFYKNEVGDRSTNIHNWTGGSSIGNSGVAGMYMRALSKDDTTKVDSVGPRTGADMKKSYFMFGDRILMMGSSITSNTGDHVETTVDNRKIKPDGSNVITVDGRKADLNGTAQALENPSWLHIQGNVAGSEIGYYFPEDITVQALKETRTGNWADQGTTSGTATDTYATFYVDHGVNPTDAGYAYVLLPGKNSDETAAYAKNPDVEILRQDGDIHAARDNKQNITSANFWEAGSVAGITVSAPASVTMKTEGDIVTIGVSDPTQRDVPITLTLAAKGTLVSADEKVTVDEESLFIKFSVDTTEGLGGTYTATFKLEESAGVELVSATTKVEDITVAPYTPFAELALPTTAVFVATDLAEHTLPILWAREDYNANAYGTYTLVGTPILPQGMLNTSGLTLEAKVTVVVPVENQLAVAGDTFIRGNDYNNENHAKDGSLSVKDDTDANYDRLALFQFELAELPENIEDVWFTFQAGYSSTDSWQSADLYLIASEGWTEANATWANTATARNGGTKLASFGRADIGKDGVVSLNVKAAVNTAVQNSDEKISFMIVCTGAAGSANQMSIKSRESNDAKQKPALSYATPLEPATATVDKENLTWLVALVGEVAADNAKFVCWDEDGFAAALAAAEVVLADEAATMTAVNSAEDALLVRLLSLRIKL